MMNPGDIVQLIYPMSVKGAKYGMAAEIVDPGTYPNYHLQLAKQIGRQLVRDEFVAVKWLDEGPENGFYHKHRFKVIQ